MSFKENIISFHIILILLTTGFAGLLISDNTVENAAAAPANIIVDINGGGAYTSIQAGIDSAKNGDTIFVWAGIYFEDIIVNKTVSLIGNGTSKSIIYGSKKCDVVRVFADAVNITGFTIKNSGIRDKLNIFSGLKLDKIENAHVYNNNFSYNHIGLFSNFSKQSLVEYNVFYNNNLSGLHLYFSDSNMIVNNTSRYHTNQSNGINIYNSKSNTIDNNTCSNNYGAILLYFSNWNNVTSNQCINNGGGIALTASSYNKIRGNVCNFNNGIGIGIVSAQENELKNNNVSLNVNGVYLSKDAWSNTICENNISFNSDTGILITNWNNNNNYFYHNNIVSNNKQLSANGTNVWNNDRNEGNFWSDYDGEDNGAGSRVAGDNIGDTKLPHLSVDNYPFVRPRGWLYPPTPTLNNPGGLDPDGKYLISWTVPFAATGYILEESNSTSFETSATIYTGAALFYEPTPRSNGTYYYRVRSFNEQYLGSWSNIENIVVDWLPAAPSNLLVKTYPPGNGLNISWTANIGDTVEYELEVSHDGDWEHLVSLEHPGNNYNHSNLIDGDTYQYRLRAKDDRSQYSAYHPAVTGIPSDTVAPAPPAGLNASAMSESSIYLSWTPNTETDLEGYRIYMNTDDSEPGHYNFQLEVTSAVRYCILERLSAESTYFFKVTAFDEVPNYSDYSGIASATTPDLTPPVPPVGLRVTDPTTSSLVLKWSKNSEADVTGYEIYKSRAASAGFEKLEIEPVTGTEYKDTGLMEDTVYYYKLKAIDDAGLASGFSETASGKTLMRQYPPEVIDPVSYLEIIEDSCDDFSINLHKVFYDPNGDELKFNFTGSVHIYVTIYPENGTVVLKPQQNWNGNEYLTFSAADAGAEVSFDVEVLVIPENDPPGPATIISPLNGITIDYGDNLNFHGQCDDPDLPYGDKLVFRWSSSIIGIIGEGYRIDNIILPPGEHEITLTVIDSSYETSTDKVHVEVYYEDVTDTHEQDDRTEPLITKVTIFIIIVLIVIGISAFIIINRTRLKAQFQKLLKKNG